MHPLVSATRSLSKDVHKMRFSDPVAFVYNPLDYAWAPHHEYLRRFGIGRSQPRTLLVGMNPGPFGMTQTGVPFGAVGIVKEFLGLHMANGKALDIKKPSNVHPKRDVLGFECTREEVSGRRLWGWAREEFGTPEKFFDRFFITNYCPLLFLHASGRNLTPDKLKLAERKPLLERCDQGLAEIARSLAIDQVIGIGLFAETAAKRVLGDSLPVGRILHPSPASPAANRGWAEAARAQLQDLGALGHQSCLG